MARNHRYTDSLLDHLSPPPLHLCLFVLVLVFVLGLSWLVNYESRFEDLMIQLKFFLMLTPVLLLLLLHCLSADRTPFYDVLSYVPETDWSPFGVALVLLLLVYMVSYQSYFHERWFPFGVK
ncbi:hypothetical protein GQ457_15G029080 [Hibiscus cannabinus]